MEKYHRPQENSETKESINDFYKHDGLRFRSNSLEGKEIHLETLQKVAKVAEITGDWLIIVDGISFQMAPSDIVLRTRSGETEEIPFGINPKYAKPFVNKGGSWGGVKEGWLNTETGEHVNYKEIFDEAMPESDL